MKDFWKRQARRIDALSLRERAIMFASLAVALVAATDALVLSPRSAEQKAVATRLRAQATELMALRGRYKELHDRQYGIETDRFINPGEDFTPEPDAADAIAPSRGRGAS